MKRKRINGTMEIYRFDFHFEDEMLFFGLEYFLSEIDDKSGSGRHYN